MKRKNLTVWFLTLCVCVILATCKTPTHQTTPPPEACIQHLIALDDSLGRIRNHACETISLAQTIRNYTDGINKHDFRGCPPDFTKAFTRHLQAWNDMIPFVEKHAGLRGEMHVLFEQLEKGPDAATFIPLLRNIWDTWAAVEAAMKQQEQN
ncbi:MAG: hypothetical protein R3D58_16195 [Saprospiraceae bacterium]|nr:hypothetical protein [Lewinellaceae bacterium]